MANPRVPGFGAISIFLFFLHATIVPSAPSIELPASYDVVWTTQSSNSAGSMPLGGGDIGLNAWAEKGDLLFYIQKSGTFDENKSFLKLGRIRLSFQPNPFAAGDFEQRLLINDGYIRFTGNDNTSVNLWVDVFNPVIHVEVDSPSEIAFQALYENWRFEDYQIRSGEQGEWVTAFHESNHGGKLA
ncbi:hypothetical protein S7711_11616 [Stachybotrys chartarum IBT 7711]|uniref:DUF5703 domain-containing protein n=1 Tax=Stachybotrys chartarum (strain CBS 109288 / IBT 7711) TaxID=1280523 RepID=A0A084AF64_STACB|nr:hypothetical protein S7711_11616 [Stachybotrys chartarum IBT 7711]